eukprot:1804258-Prymnesium_polylepis.1
MLCWRTIRAHCGGGASCTLVLPVRSFLRAPSPHLVGEASLASFTRGAAHEDGAAVSVDVTRRGLVCGVPLHGAASARPEPP